jgi:hypothetical protein
MQRSFLQQLSWRCVEGESLSASLPSPTIRVICGIVRQCGAKGSMNFVDASIDAPKRLECRADLPLNEHHPASPGNTPLTIPMQPPPLNRGLSFRRPAPRHTQLDCIFSLRCFFMTDSQRFLLLSSTASLLNLAHRDHFLSQVVLVVSDAAIPSSDCLVLANQDVFRNFVEQSITISVNSPLTHSTYCFALT